MNRLAREFERLAVAPGAAEKRAAQLRKTARRTTEKARQFVAAHPAACIAAAVAAGIALGWWVKRK